MCRQFKNQTNQTMKNTSNYMPKCIALFAIILFGQLNLFGQTGETPWYVGGNTQSGDMKFGRKYSEAGKLYFFNSADNTSLSDYDMVLTYDPSYLGIGTVNPTSNLHIHSEEIFDPYVIIKDPIKTKDGIVSGPVSKSTLQLTNHFSGQGEDDGLFIESYSENAIIRNEEAGDLRLLNAGTTLSLNDAGDFILRRGLDRSLTVKAGGNVGIGTDVPAAKFHVKGNANFEGSSTFKIVGPAIIIENAETNYQWEWYTGAAMTNTGLGLYDRVKKKYVIAVDSSQNVGIGTVSPRHKLDVKGSMRACKLIANDLNGWCDYVFEDDYELMSLAELESFITMNKHLPGIPTEEEVAENGVDLGEMNKKLLQKVEELSLYIIEQEKRITNLENQLK